MRKLLILALLAASMHAAAKQGDGEKLYEEYLDKGLVYGNEAWQAYVQELGQLLLSHSPHAGKEYHFYVIDTSRVNASAYPDAYIFVDRGILAYLSSEDELAAVVGHEIAHVTARHARRSQKKNLLGKSVGLIAWLTTGVGDLMNVTDAYTRQQISGFGREAELEADRLGGEYMARAGYNPLAIIDVVQVLKDQDVFRQQVERQPASYHGLFRSHPKNDKRLHDAVGYAQQSLPPETAMPLRDYWEMVDGLVYGDETMTGVVRDTTFYHGNWRIAVEFPDDWTVRKMKSEVSATAPGGNPEAFITMGGHSADSELSPLEYLTETLKRDDIKSGEAVEINGFQAYIGEVQNEGTDAKLKLIGLLYRDRAAYLFSGEAGPNGDPDALRENFVATMHTLRYMTAEDAQVASKLRIRVKIAEPDKTYADLARESAIPKHAEEQLRLLNAGYPNGEPRAGNFIKVVE